MPDDRKPKRRKPLDTLMADSRFISKNTVETSPPEKPGRGFPRNEMHQHYEWRDLYNAFGMGGPTPVTLDEGTAQAKIAALIQSLRQEYNMPANWDPRDVNLPNEPRRRK